MKITTTLALGALLATAAACGDDDKEQQAAAVPAFQMQQCSPVDPQCQLTEPPRLYERPGPGAQ